ncbi:MAG: hypothetical protein M0Z80_07570 [Treponema sp.]|nr:hypothetical protein [Treponema sp.]
MDIAACSREGGAEEVAAGHKWTAPYDPATFEPARRGDWSLVLTPTISVPRT